MFKNFLLSLDKQPKDSILERLEREPAMNKYWLHFGASILCLFALIVVGSFTMLLRLNPPVPQTMGVNLKTKKGTQLITLPYPHQSFKNVSGWLLDAITASYSFDFAHFPEEVQKASYYYTPDGFKMYVQALQTSKLDKTIVQKKLEISVVPMQNPVMINGGSFGSTEFWRFRVPVLTNYYGGGQPIVQKYMVEVLVIRVPAYENPKGLAIAEFNMAPL